MYTFTGLVVGGMFFQFGNNGSLTLFNYGFIFITIIIFMYTPLMPVLLKCKFYTSETISYALRRTLCLYVCTLFFSSSQRSAAIETRIFQPVVRTKRLFLRTHVFTTPDAGKKKNAKQTLYIFLHFSNKIKKKNNKLLHNSSKGSESL